MSFVGTTTEILDGKLSPKQSLPEDVTLIIDRAYDGPSEELFFVTDTEAAKNVFGRNSPLIQGMRHAFAGGSRNVALYRIGGGSATLTNLFGPYTALRTTAQKVGAGSNLTVYAGPRATDPTRSIIIVKEGDKIVYSNAPGQMLDLGVIKVEGFNASEFPYQIGTVDAPIAYADIINNIGKKGMEAFTATASQTDFVLAAPVTSIANVMVTAAGNTVATLVNAADYTVNLNGSNQVISITLDTGAAAGDVYEINTLLNATTTELTNLGIAYVTGKDSMSITLNALYELYDKAFIDLETIDVFGVAIADLFNCRSIAAGDNTDYDRLTYVNRIETDEGFEYEWSDVKFIYRSAAAPLLTVTNPALAAVDDLGQPIVVKQYHETDFAHRLAMWAWSQSSVGTYVNANISPKGPEANYTVAINKWIGRPPTKNIYGEIVENGYGLLGNRFIGGLVGRNPGFYATDTGYPDGNPLFDSSGVIIDIGKYLSIPIIPVFITSEAFGSSDLVIRGSSASYAGLITRIEVGDSTTNIVLPNVTGALKLKAGKIQQLSDAGFVVLEDKPKGLTVYSGDLATQESSDFDFISTALAVTYVIKRLRDVTDPYIGRGVSSTLMAALFNAIDSELKSAIARGYINGSSFNLVSDGPHRLMLPLSLQAKEELRSVNVILSLTENNSYVI